MKNIWKIAVLLSLAVLFSQSCKEKEAEEKGYVDGILSLSFPTFVNPGYTQTYDLESLMSLTRPDGGKIGYYITDPSTGVRDTVVLGNGTMLKKSFTVTAPSTLSNFTVTFGSFCEDDAYYGRTASKTFTVVSPGFGEKSSITGFKGYDTDGSFTDARDGKAYMFTEAGGVCWMRSNLAWSGAGVAFQECEAMTDVFGNYYTRAEALSACPEGWTLPSEADFVALAKSQGVDVEALSDAKGFAGRLMGDLYFNGTKLWEYWPSVRVTDSSHLSFMPLGYVSGDSEGSLSFEGYTKYAAFWMLDEYEGKGLVRYIYHDKDIVYIAAAPDESFAASVRCVKK